MLEGRNCIAYASSSLDARARADVFTSPLELSIGSRAQIVATSMSVHPGSTFDGKTIQFMVMSLCDAWKQQRPALALYFGDDGSLVPCYALLHALTFRNYSSPGEYEEWFKASVSVTNVSHTTLARMAVEETLAGDMPFSSENRMSLCRTTLYTDLLWLDDKGIAFRTWWNEIRYTLRKDWARSLFLRNVGRLESIDPTERLAAKMQMYAILPKHVLDSAGWSVIFDWSAEAVEREAERGVDLSSIKYLVGWWKKNEPDYTIPGDDLVFY